MIFEVFPLKIIIFWDFPSYIFLRCKVLSRSLFRNHKKHKALWSGDRKSQRFLERFHPSPRAWEIGQCMMVPVRHTPCQPPTVITRAANLEPNYAEKWKKWGKMKHWRNILLCQNTPKDVTENETWKLDMVTSSSHSFKWNIGITCFLFLIKVHTHPPPKKTSWWEICVIFHTQKLDPWSEGELLKILSVAPPKW